MDRSDVITLIGETYTTDDLGVQKAEKTAHRAFCQVQSINRQEFFSAGSQGLKPAYVFTVFSGDYNDEELLEYHGKQYSVYRAYQRKDDFVELYTELKRGTAHNGD